MYGCIHAYIWIYAWMVGPGMHVLIKSMITDRIG